MNGTCFVVAFGHGKASGDIASPQEAAEDLRRLVDMACQGAVLHFDDQICTSVAPGGVMFALRDDEPTRALALCQAVAALLEQQARTHLTLPPVCAAITFGPLRQVDVLGFSSNFEGRAAIAAARVVAKLAPGACAIEQSLWDFTSLVRACSAPQDVEGKAHDKTFQVRIHRDIRFPTESLLQESRAEAPEMPSLPPYAAAAQEARERIAALLDDPKVYALRDAILRQGQGQSAADVLVPDQAPTLLSVLKILQDATRDCLQTLARTQPSHIGPTKTAASSLLGCLTALALKRDAPTEAAHVFDPWQSRVQRTLPLVSEAGVEVAVASLGKHPARFRKLKHSRDPRAVGKHSIPQDELETGLTHSDRLTGLLQRVWCAVLHVEHAPTSFGTHELRRLKSVLNTHTEDRTRLYYITLPPTDSSSALDAPLLESLLRTLPSLRVFFFRGEHSTGLLCVDEYDLWARIDQFLDMVEQA